MTYRWTDPAERASLELEVAYHPIIASILSQRGIRTKENAELFLFPDYYRDCHDPFLFQDMQKAIERISRALSHNEKITIYCDYDVDGLASGSLLYETIKQLGGTVNAIMNHRENDGYGLRTHAIQESIESGTTLFITTDCGISNATEVCYANERGVDVIITDHHTVPALEKDLPPAYAIIHPLVRADAYPCKILAGGGSAFKLAQAIIRTDDSEMSRRRLTALSQKGHAVDWQAFEKWLLDLVCLSTVGDCVPLKGENRVFVRYGLQVLKKSQRPGLQALLRKMKKRNMELNSRAVSFFLAPRINAASRMEHARIAFDLLTTHSQEEAERLADVLELKNTERQKKTEHVISHAKEQLDVYHAEQKKILVGNADDWPLGILGLVAGRLCDYYRKPVVLMTGVSGNVSGAARSVIGVHIANVFSEMSHYFDRFGGHQAAGGFALKKDSLIDDVRQSLESIGDRLITTEYDSQKALSIDAICMLSDLTWDTLSQLKNLEPYGQDNPKPKLMIKSSRVVDKRILGKTGKHVRITLDQDGVRKQCIGFSMSDVATEINEGDYVDIVCELDEHEWNGYKDLQISLVDIRKS